MLKTGTSLKARIRVGLALLLIGSMALPAPTAFAAPFGEQRHFRFGNDGPFNADPDPCARRGRFMRGGGDCPGEGGGGRPQRNFQRGNFGPRAPGSNAFGLQFDYGGY